MDRPASFAAIGVLLIPLLCPAAAPAAQAVAAQAAADRRSQDSWRAGFARREITPEKPLFLAGYASRNRPFDHVESPLFVKALALEDADGRRAVLVTCDIIGFKRMAAELICERIQAASTLDRKNILLNASHIHTGPSLLLDADERSERMTGDQAGEQVAWTRRLIDLTVEAALEALAELEPARLSYGVGFAPFVMNRREWTPGGVRLGFNPSGYADRSVPILRIDAADGTLRGVVFGAAVHNTTLTQDHYFVSGDFAGYAQAHLEQKHPGAQAMFMTGCAGSANPHPRGTLEQAQQHGETLGREVCRALAGDLAAVAGPLDARFATIELPLADPPTRAEIDAALSSRGGWESQMARAMLRVLESGESLPASRAYELSVWRFGDDLTLVGLSGEVVGEFVPLLQAAVEPGRLWIAAYCHDVFGYVPTARILEEGGYETRGTYSGRPGLFSPKAEPRLVDAVRRLARAAAPASDPGARR
ncbi:MAG TPA: neutral/alkaline non-lysosomal ceramidase N-terminal domain-containing protein [Planctomycetaceae bacterium]|nr:neutral/alkaline non-lysosomal ceramidase N-terminal domain-containing protein [Planctomycetaceae bacterium]